jgi:hypothetical protein
VVLAHETWFVSQRPPSDWSFAGQGLTLGLLAAAVAIALAVRFASRLWNGVDVGFLARLAPWMPFALRIHLAVSLVGMLSLGDYLSPAMHFDRSFGSVLLGIGMAVVAISMVSGYRVRQGAWLLVALGPIGMLEFGVVPVLARLDLLGLAAFLLIAGPGRWSADDELGRAVLPGVEQLGRAVWALRLMVGGALIFVAFQEKLADPQLARDFLHQQPDFNIADSLFGLGWTNTEFIRVAGAMEVLFGLLLISGRMPQVMVVAVGIPFNATLYFLGTTELVGHLPVYGAMLTLLVFGSDPRLREATGAIRPP